MKYSPEQTILELLLQLKLLEKQKNLLAPQLEFQTPLFMHIVHPGADTQTG